MISFDNMTVESINQATVHSNEQLLGIIFAEGRYHQVLNTINLIIKNETTSLMNFPVICVKVLFNEDSLFNFHI
ncbi:hypothetical protein TRFO_32270 [Tritrichomonas foetus]|uniref:Uncharacterized protein n=1 Tax=Tritrichomonas foetus TaxID=1144522 RepID=A0A1J4JP68_9EUKA|nr:hypothetical protein TRFO_32270 [Tritrichomonas foetus]|eukprot:OHT00921.1 hypothetical protein TRFO_32270 [Tritrichomonas foetus]